MVSQLHAARELLMFLSVYVMNMFLCYLYIYVHAQGIHDHFNFAERERELLRGSAVVVIMQPLRVILFYRLFVTLLPSFRLPANT